MDGALSVLLVGNFLSEAGGNRGVCEELAIRLAAAGWHVTTTSRRAGKTARLLDMIGTAWRQRSGYAVAHVDVFSGPAFLWAEAVCGTLRIANKPYVLTLHGGNLPRFAMDHPARVRRLLQSAAAVTSPSRYLIDALSRFRPDIRFMPNGLDLSAYPRRVSAASPRLIWLRAFHRVYNPELAVRVLARLADRFPAARLTMIGPDKGDGALQHTERAARELGVFDRLDVRGQIPKSAVPDALAKADVFLNTTHIDNAPITVLEAMACGLCVVTTNVGGIPYLVTHERDGLLVAAGDAEAMADAVARVLADRALAERLSRNARLRAEEHDWAPIVAEWGALLGAVAEGRVDAAA
jgi:glycosyltransferase involved in cell wall biosynthesis